MRVIVLGAAGFLGARLAATLAAAPRVGERAIQSLVLFDRRPPPPPRTCRCRVGTVVGDLREARALDALFASPPDLVFHLAATLTLDAEADFRGGLETNVLAFIDLLERCRAAARPPVLVFASSISTFGSALPETVGDDVFQVPATSYGTHKAIAEHLLRDYARRGFVDGRALRLPIVLLHPGPPSASVSDQVAALVREPLRGHRVTCRMAPHSRLAVASVDNVVSSLLRLAGLPSGDVPPARTMNLPALSTTPLDLVSAADRRRPGAAAQVDWRPDAAVQRIIDGWPARFTSERALALGFGPDGSVDDIVAAFQRSEGTAP